MPKDISTKPLTYTIGLDVGGTKIAGGVVEFPAGRILLKQVIPTKSDRQGDAVLADALNLAEALLIQAEQSKLRIEGIGIGVCELVDLQGHITSSHAVAWQDLPIQEAFSQLAPSAVESDVRAAALAEALFGAGQPYEIIVFVTIGTGISYCLVQDGYPYAGTRGNALILASSPLTTRCPHCHTRLQPVLEEFASGPALVSRYQTQVSKPVTGAEEVLAAAKAGDARAVEIVGSAGEALGVALGWLVNILDPEVVVIGGGLGLAGGLYWDTFITSTRAHTWAEASQKTPIIPASLGPEAGLIGAAGTAALKLDLIPRKGGGGLLR